MGLTRSTATQPALTTLWRVGSGRPQAGSPPHTRGVTRRHCYQTAWSLSQGELTGISPRGPNYTTRRAGLGLPQAPSTPNELITRRRCYKSAWSLLQGELEATALLARALNS